MQNTFDTPRVELKGWRCWRNIRGTGITVLDKKITEHTCFESISI